MISGAPSPAATACFTDVVVELVVDTDKGTSEKALAVLDGVLCADTGLRSACAYALVMPVLVKKMFCVSDMAKEFARLRALAPLLCRGHRRWRALLRGTACGLLPEAAPGVLRRRDRGSGQRAAQAAQWFQGQRRVHRDDGLQGAQEVKRPF